MSNHNVKSDHELRGEDPRTIDWTTRQAYAAVPFEVRDGLPINPTQGVDLKAGRGDLWHWGEAVCSDAVVLTTIAGERRLLLIERGDGHGWAVPGGGLDEGESAEAGCVRELMEETGLVCSIGEIERMLPARIVPDPRAGEHAWMVTIPGVIDLHPGHTLDVTGQDDAADAAWFPADSYAELVDAVEARGGQIFAAHVDLLREVLDGEESNRA